MASNNMYRVGDYVYFETSAQAPYQIRRIEELNKVTTGAVEAKVICYYRRRDISSTLVQLADKHQRVFGEDDQDSDNSSSNNGISDSNIKTINSQLSDLQKHQLKHRELFLSRQIESLPATHIRGKCSVALLNETESLTSYLERDDSFFYQLVYDPVQKTLLADRGEIRIGTRWQAHVPPMLDSDEKDPRLDEPPLEKRVWDIPFSLSPFSGEDLTVNKLTDSQISEFLLLARSVGTLARAYDSSAVVRQPSLLSAAASASRDITKEHSYALLHQAGYDLNEAFSLLLPSGQPLLCRDEMEEWSASEGNLFEEALGKYGKEFHDVRKDFLPWKSLSALIEYYYMWKTTDRYVQQKRAKAQEADHKLKQVYIPNYNKLNPAVLYNKPMDNSRRGCENCSVQNSPQWYAWGPPNLLCRLCSNCWAYWKKYGGLKNPTTQGRVLSIRRAENSEDRLSNQNSANSAPNSNGNGNAPMNDGIVFTCNQPLCGKQFKMKAQYHKHQVLAHGIPLPPDFVDAPSSAVSNHLGNSVITRPRGGTHRLQASALHKLCRVLARDLVKPKRLARRPGFIPSATIMQIRQRVQSRINKVSKPLDQYLHSKMKFPPLNNLIGRFFALHNQHIADELPAFLRRSTSDSTSEENASLSIKLKEAKKLAFPCNDAQRVKVLQEIDAKHFSLTNGSASDDIRLASSHQSIIRKRTFENGSSNASRDNHLSVKRQLLSSNQNNAASSKNGLLNTPYYRNS